MERLCECGCGEPTPVAKKTCTRDGVIKGGQRRFVAGHNRRAHRPEYRVDPESGCWNWLGYISSGGYGRLNRGRDGVKYAHRYYYERLVGPIPSGAELDHLCRNRACVNPAHLEPVTHRENSRRGARTQLTRDEIGDIRSRFSSGESQTSIAAEYSIHSSTVSRIVRRKRWAKM